MFVTRTLVTLALFAVALGRAGADPSAPPIDAGTHLKFHLAAPLSSNDSKTGQHFDFVLLDPILVDGKTLFATGAAGLGTLLLAGKAGTSGHEGDLTLRIDSVCDAGGTLMTFDDQRIAINGQNKKLQSHILGFIPYVGVGARLIRGSDIAIAPSTPIETVLLRPATITEAGCTPLAQ